MAEALGISSPKGWEAVTLYIRDAKQAGDAVAARTLWAEKAVAHQSGIERLEQSRPRSLLQSIVAWGEALLERVTHAFGTKARAADDRGTRFGAECSLPLTCFGLLDTRTASPLHLLCLSQGTTIRAAVRFLIGRNGQRKRLR
ncbi:hypothetical protein [Croceibacterium ferulae]|uniref:hypothetical protein n=1 Tax=Croceibacterium ferulae TaxID=1854641 RepID=UPI0013901B1A|nr:hypothetical protein [Croceibacterium ferulae]